MTRLRCGCAPLVGAIDVHTHFVPSSFPPAAGRLAAAKWPVLSAPECGHAFLQFGAAARPRRLPSTCWETPVRLADMAQEGIGVQVLSPMPDLFGYALAEQDGIDLCRYVNDAIAEIVIAHPGRFLGLGMVPLQSADAAVAELERIAASLPLEGVEVGTNVAGRAIGEPRLHPFFAAAERLDLAVFVHPAQPLLGDMLVGPPELAPLVGFPTDSAFALASLITGGVLDAFSSLRIAASHCGGGFAMVLPRLQHAWERVPAVHDTIATAPAQLARRLFVDTLALSPHALRHALALYGEDRLMLGSDYPFALGDRNAVTSLEAAVPDAAVRERLLRSNALAFLGAQGDGTA